MKKRFAPPFLPILLAGVAAVVFSGCSARQSANGLVPIKFQADWYPQPEQGGFYNALIKGYYKEEGLDVTIIPGGPYGNGLQMVASGAAQFSMGHL